MISECTIKITLWNTGLKCGMQIHYLCGIEKHELAIWEICAIMTIQNFLLISNPKTPCIGKHVRYKKANRLYIMRLIFFFSFLFILGNIVYSIKTTVTVLALMGLISINFILLVKSQFIMWIHSVPSSCNFFFFMITLA